MVKNDGDTLYLDKDGGCNGIKPILNNKGDTAYPLMSKKVFSSKPILKSSIQIEAKTPKELASQLESYKKKGYFVEEMYEENSVYHILLMKKHDRSTK